MLAPAAMPPQHGDAEGLAPFVHPSDKEETATQTPRSASIESLTESANETPRGSEKSEGHDEADDHEQDADDDDDKDDDGDSSSPQQEEYYAFLRELAGSFEAAGDDAEESEEGSDEGSEDDAEDEEVVGPVQKPAQPGPAPLVHGKQSERPTTAHTSMAAAKIGQTSPALEEKDKFNKGNTSPGAITKGDAAGAKGWRPLGLRHPSTSSTESVSSGDEESESETEDEQEDGTNDVPEADRSKDGKRCKVPTPSHDLRGPLMDDYDVIQATKQFASARCGTAIEQQKEDLQSAIDQKLSQALHLLRPSQCEHTKQDLRNHYAHVRAELLREVQTLQAAMDALVNSPATELEAQAQ